MEETVAETQSREQLQAQRDGTVNGSGAHFLQHPSSRSWTGHRGTSTHTTSLGGNHTRQDKDAIPVCRDYFRGTCFRGSSCRYFHDESGERDGSRFYRSEHGALGVVANLGNSLSYRENKDSDSKTRFASAGYRRRSPCRNFRSGTCPRGATCPYLHAEVSRYGTPTCCASVEQQEVHGAVRNPSIGEEDRNNTLRISQGHEEANKENNMRKMTFSGRKRSRSPCRNFLRGNYNFGSNCRRLHPENTFVRSWTDFGSLHDQRFAENGSNPGCNVSLRTPQGHDESNMHNSLRSGSFLREHRRRSPCQNFLSGRCYRGESCAHLHPSRVYDRTRYDWWRSQQRDGAPATSGSPHLNDGSVGTISRPFQNHEDHKNSGIQPRCDAYHVNQARSTMDGMQLIGNRENMDITSKSWSLERQKSSNASDFGRNKLIREPEVCLRFTRGRCHFGDSCRYLHGYHEYASSNGSTRPAEAAAVSMTFGVANQHANTMMVQQHNDVSMTAQLDIRDQKGDPPVIDGKKCEIPDGKSAGICSSAEGHGEISLWSQPFERQRSRSRSPLIIPENNTRCRNFRRYDFQMDLGRDWCRNVERFQYPECRSYSFERPVYHANSHNSSTDTGTSMKSCYHDKYDPKLAGPQRHDEVVNQGFHSASASKNDETDSATLVGHPSHMDQNDEEKTRYCISVDRSQGAAASGDWKSHSASSCKEQVVSLEAICSSMLGKEGNDEKTNDNTAEVMPLVKADSGENIRVSKRDQGSVSCEDSVKGANTSKLQGYGSVKNIEINVEPALASAEVSRRKLLVLDINGILVDILAVYPHKFRPDTNVSGKGVFKRPFCDDFLQFCFERYDVGIWSSRTMKNVTMVVGFLMKESKKRLLFCWDQSHCTSTGYYTLENREKPLVLKELKYLWDNKGESLPWKKGYYNETNTILLDDSPYKALRNPPYTAIFPYPYNIKNSQDNSLGPGGDLRVYLEKLAEAENIQKFIQENPFGQKPITKEHRSWAFYAKIAGAYGNQQGMAEVVISDGIQLQEKANNVGTSDRSILEENAEIVGTSNRSAIEEKAKILGALDGSQLEKKDEIVDTNGSILVESTETVGTSNRSGIEENTKIIGASGGSQLEEKHEIVGASNGKQSLMERNAEIVEDISSTTVIFNISVNYTISQYILKNKPSNMFTSLRGMLKVMKLCRNSLRCSHLSEEIYKKRLICIRWVLQVWVQSLRR